MKNTIFEAPHYTVFSTLLLLYLCSVHTLSSVPCSQIPSAYVTFLMSEIKFHIRTEQQAKLYGKEQVTLLIGIISVTRVTAYIEF